MTNTVKSGCVAVILAVVAAFPAVARRAEGGCERGDADRVVTLEGKVMELEDRMALFQAEGKTYLLHMGPRWYWDDRGYALEAKDRIRVTGQISGADADNLNLYPHTITRDGAKYDLADADGRPEWAGRRRGRGAGQGTGARDACGRGRCGRGSGRGHGAS